MPFQMVWVPAPNNMNLPVLVDLPEDFRKIEMFSEVKEADGYIDGKYTVFYYCMFCKGWIEGHANEYHVDDLHAHVLAGRRGFEYYCKRCGKEIAFSGVMS